MSYEEPVDFQLLQRQFTTAMRSGASEGYDDVALSGVSVYQELLFNNIRSLVSAGFPVLHEILEGDRWDHLIRDFFHSAPR